jgi:hypothetical protein
LSGRYVKADYFFDTVLNEVSLDMECKRLIINGIQYFFI